VKVVDLLENIFEEGGFQDREWVSSREKERGRQTEIIEVE